MTPQYADDWLTVYGGDCRAVLATLPAESVHCVVTSPPYWGLRDYGTPDQLGLEPTPEEYVANMVAVFREVRRVLRRDGTLWLNLGDSYAGPPVGTFNGGGFKDASAKSGGRDLSGIAGGSQRSKVVSGLKAKDLVGIPWRVAFALQADGWWLRSDIVWNKPNPMPESVTDRPTKSHEMMFLFAKGQWKSRVVQLADGNGKGLHLDADFWPTSAPVRLADADFGIRLAAAILDLPESQQKFGLTALDPQVGQQGPRDVSGDSIGALPAVQGPAVIAARLLAGQASTKEFMQELYRRRISLGASRNLLIDGLEAELPLPPGVTTYGEAAIAIHYPGEIRQLDLVHHTIIASEPSTCTYYFDADAVREAHSRDWGGEEGLMGSGRTDWATRAGRHDATRTAPPQFNPAGRNIRSVWTIPTQPYPGAHFAVFPPKLVEPCIKAGTSERGVCAECGAPWRRVVERVIPVDPGKRNNKLAGHEHELSARQRSMAHRSLGGRYQAQLNANPPQTTGWHPSCSHDAATIPATVLDPFAGSGTTGLVAQRLSRRALLIDLNPDYLEQQLERNAALPLGLVG